MSFQFFHVTTKVLYSGHLKAQAIVNEAPAHPTFFNTSVVHPGTSSPTIPEIFLIVRYCNLLGELQALGSSRSCGFQELNVGVRLADKHLRSIELSCQQNIYIYSLCVFVCMTPAIAVHVVVRGQLVPVPSCFVCSVENSSAQQKRLYAQNHFTGHKSRQVGRYICMSVSVCHDACLGVSIAWCSHISPLPCVQDRTQVIGLGHKYLYQLSYLLSPRSLNFIIYTNGLVSNTCEFLRSTLQILQNVNLQIISASQNEVFSMTYAVVKTAIVKSVFCQSSLPAAPLALQWAVVLPSTLPRLCCLPSALEAVSQYTEVSGREEGSVSLNPVSAHLCLLLSAASVTAAVTAHVLLLGCCGKTPWPRQFMEYLLGLTRFSGS